MELYVITQDGLLTNHRTKDGLSLLVGLEFLKETQPEYCWDYVVQEEVDEVIRYLKDFESKDV